MSRILVVDDNLHNRYFLESLLRGHGHEVLSAEDGEQALRRGYAEPPDLVVSDILMPKMDGFALCKAWRANETLQSIPFVFYTATYTEPEDEALGLRLGADRFLIKPMEPDELLEALEEELFRKTSRAQDRTASFDPLDPPLNHQHLERVARKLSKKITQLEIEAERRKKAEDALTEREELYRSVFLATSEGLLLFDRDGRIIEANPAASAIFGFTRDELLRCEGGDLFSAESESTFESFLCCEPGAPFETKALPRRKDGSWVPIILRGRAITLADQRCYLAVVLDQSEKNQLQEKLLHSEKTEIIGRLSGGIAHDFNNLLQVILGRSEVAMEELSAEDPVLADLAVIQGVAERAMGLIERLLQLSRSRPVERKRIPIDSFIEDLAPLFRWMMGSLVEVDFEPDAGNSSVVADLIQLEQVLLNLCVNGREAMPNGGRILLQTERIEVPADFPEPEVQLPEGNYVRVSVSDNGRGMDTDTMQHAIDPFFTTKNNGNGLGLATVRDIVERHGGAVFFSSELGRGSCFSVLLPLSEGSRQDAEEELL